MTLPHIAPMLATTGSLPRNEDEWAFEIKWDGVRALCYLDGGVLRMESRNLLDITPRYPELHGLAERVDNAILDAEVVAFDEGGRPSFGLLQSRMHLADAGLVRRRMVEVPVVLMVFDVLWLDGESLMGRPWTERREALTSLGLDGDGAYWRVSTAFPGQGAALVAASKERGLEGVLAKKMDSVYEPGKRSRCWLKIKNVNRQEVVIGGWLPGEGNRLGRLGALVVGYYEGDELRFAGKVGTGFSDKVLAELGDTLAPLARETSPFADKVPWKQARFVEPVLVADVEFAEWTLNGTLRHPSYKGLRADKSPREVVREPVSGRQ